MQSLLLLCASAAIAAALISTGCTDSTTRDPAVTPGALRAEHTTATADPGGGPAHDSNGKSHITERRTTESRTARSTGGSTRPSDRPPPRSPPPRPPR